MVSQPNRDRTVVSVADASWLRLLKQARKIFGDRLTTVILTGERQMGFDPGAAMHASQRDRRALAAALEIAMSLLELEEKSTVQAWFVGMNPMLQERPPALVVRTDPESVRTAARDFVAYG